MTTCGKDPIALGPAPSRRWWPAAARWQKHSSISDASAEAPEVLFVANPLVSVWISQESKAIAGLAGLPQHTEGRLDAAVSRVPCGDGGGAAASLEPYASDTAVRSSSSYNVGLRAAPVCAAL